MQYLTGLYALNLPCPSLKTCGDWHLYAIDWETPLILDSEKSVFKNFGIIDSVFAIPLKKYMPAANHIRALLDLLELGKFNLAQGMRDDFICNDTYNQLIFSKVDLLKNSKNWEEINEFMKKEYAFQWQRHLNEVTNK